MDFLLSILIPTLPERKAVLDRLMGSISKAGIDKFGDVEILTDNRIARNKGGPTIAAKRNRLYRQAKGLFSVQIDDDDIVSPTYLKDIIHTIKIVKGIQAIEHDIAVRSRGGNSMANVSMRNGNWRHNTAGKYKYYQPIVTGKLDCENIL